MRNGATIRLSMLFWTLMLVAGAGAQRRTLSRAAIDSLMHPTMYKEQVLRFDRTSINMGAMYDTDSVRTMKFAFKNVKNTPVTITRVTTTCGCTVADYDRAPLIAGANGTVAVKFNPTGKAGTVSSDIFVYTTLSDKNPVAKLSVTGNVIGHDEWDFLPQTMGNLRLKSKEVTFADVTAEGRFVERIACANAGIKPIEPRTNALPEYATFKAEPAILQPGEEGDLVISIDAAKIPSSLAGEFRFRILLEGVGASPVQSIIKATVRPKK